jgi:Ca-activated chloride channel homolog
MLSEFSTYEWANPWWFLAVFPIAFVAWRKIIKADAKPTSIAFSHLLGKKPIKSWRSRFFPYLPWLLILSMVLIVVALARPRKTLVDDPITGQGIDIVISIDVSLSMLARDFDPNRLEASKEVATSFIDKRKNDRIGFVIFSGESFDQCPLTFDHEIVKMFISSIETGILKDGTAIGLGLASAVNRLKDSDAKSKVAILLTDGVNNSGNIDPYTAIELAKTYGVKVYTIGVGSNGVVEMPNGVNQFGEIMYTMGRGEIDEALLQNIAQQTGGQYFRAVDQTSLISIYDEIDRLEKTEIETNITKQYKEYFRPWLIAAALFFLVWWILRMTLFSNTLDHE